MVHPNFLSVAGPAGQVELANVGFARGSFEGTVSLTRGAGSHPLSGGIRTLTIVGIKGELQVEQRGANVTLQADGVRVEFARAEVARNGDAVRVTVQK